MDTVVESIQELTSLGPDLQVRLLKTIVILLLIGVVRHLVGNIIMRQAADLRARYRWRKISSYLLGLLGVLMVGRVWFEGFASLATYLGLLSAGVAFALRDLIIDLAGWFFILWRRPFVVGDRVQIGGFAGDVVDQRVFQFTLLEIGNWVDADQSTGRVVHVPNGKVLNEPLANYTQGLEYIWNELPVLVTFESDWRKAKRILQQIATAHRLLDEEKQQEVLRSTRRYMIFYSTLQPIVYTSVEASGILLTIRYICDPRRRRGTTEKIWESVLDEFEKHDDIDFAYPTQRFFSNTVEGKVGARAEAR